MTSFNLQEELQHIQDLSSYIITNEVDLSDPDAVNTALDHVVEAIASNPEAVIEPEVLDEYRSLLKHSSELSSSLLSKLFDSITSGLTQTITLAQQCIDSDDQDAFTSYRHALEVYGFLLNWFVTRVAERGGRADEDGQVAAPTTKSKRGAKGTTSKSKRNTPAPVAENWNWAEHIIPTLTLISKLLKIKSHRLWMSAPDRDGFINCVTRPAYHIMESETHMKIQDVRLGVYKIICLAVKYHGHAFSAQVSIMQCLQYFEHLSEPMAEVLSLLNTEFQHTQLAEEILREIAAKNFNAQDTKGPRSFSKFLVHLASLSPKLVLKQMSLLLEHLDSESYPMRMAMIEIIGILIAEIAQDESGAEGGAVAVERAMEKREKKLNVLFELLFERFLDLSGYVRVKVLSTLVKLCDLHVKFPKQRAQMTTHAVAALQDKSSSVRRWSITLLTKLILTHPFGLIHGGPLNLHEWEERYEVVKKEFKALDEKMGVTALQENAEGMDGDADATGEVANEEEDGEGGAEDDFEDDEDEEAQDGDGSPSRPRVRREGRGEGEEGEEGDPTASPPRKKRPKLAKKKSRHSALDLAAAISQDQALAALDTQNHTKLKLTKKYIADALFFIRSIEEAKETLSDLLVSTNKAEVLESMEFFRVANMYEMDCAELGIKKMLHLIWTKDNNATTTEDGKELKGVRSRLLETYRSLYFDPIPDAEPKQQINRIAKNMIERTYDATFAELTSLEELLRTMMGDRQIHIDVINKLWHVYSVDREIPRCQRRGAIIILGMVALAKREVVTERIDTLLKVGLGPLGKADLVLARYTCVALQRLSGSVKKVKGSLTDKIIRFPMEHPLFRKLRDAIQHPCKSRDWFGMAEQAVNTVYLLGEQPDTLCNEIIRDFTVRVFSAPAPVAATTGDNVPVGGGAETDGEGDETATNRGLSLAPGDSVPPTQAESTPAPPSNDTTDSFLLSQLLFLVGHVAIKHLVYLELVERDLKRRKDEAAKEKSKKAAGKGNNKDGEELDQVAGNAEDEIGDHILDVREREMLYGPNSILGVFGPMLVHICASPKKYRDGILRTTATLSLSKLMCVSSQFCEENLLLLFKIFQTSKDPTIRSNIVIALGDIAVCFNNMIDENSNNLYEGLTDKALNVKKNTLMVLTHLILNGMIKVKGQLGEMAKCLEDPETRIADLAKLFFTELSTKDNAIYNNLPDVISHLSVGEHAVDEETFQSTMKYIFTFIEKEKQAESIVEKLCQRFRLTDEPRQWQDIAYCLSLLPFKSERSVKKLIEGLPFYQDKLHNEVVYARFAEILAKARTNKSVNKPDSELKEFETILNEHKEKGQEDQALEQTMQKKTVAARRKAARRAGRKGD